MALDKVQRKGCTTCQAEAKEGEAQLQRSVETSNVPNTVHRAVSDLQRISNPQVRQNKFGSLQRKLNNTQMTDVARQVQRQSDPAQETASNEVSRQATVQRQTDDAVVSRAAETQGQSLGNFEITHYTFAREDDPIYAKEPKISIPGLPAGEKYKRNFVTSNTGVRMQGTGLAENGKYIMWAGGGKYKYGMGGAKGKPDPWKTIAVDPKVIPLLSKVNIDIYKNKGTFTANDTGGAIKGKHIDVFVGPVTIKEAYSLGTKRSNVTLSTGASTPAAKPPTATTPAIKPPTATTPAAGGGTTPGATAPTPGTAAPVAGPSAIDFNNKTGLAQMAEAAGAGEKNGVKLTDMVFYARHPDRKGKALNPATDAALVSEWKAIRSGVVTVALEIASAKTSGSANKTQLTDAGFYALHPDRKGKPLTAADSQLISEWKAIGENLVAPMGAGKAASPRPATSTPTAEGKPPSSGAATGGVTAPAAPAPKPKQPAPTAPAASGGATGLATFSGTNFVGTKVTADKGFFPSLQKIDQVAGQNKVKVYITSSYRRAKTDGIVKGASRSNHMVGHAIDMNVQHSGGLANANALYPASLKKQPQSVQGFISGVKAAGLRWGGDFSPSDPVHIDDGFNQNPKAWDAKFKEIRSGK